MEFAVLLLLKQYNSNVPQAYEIFKGAIAKIQPMQMAASKMYQDELPDMERTDQILRKTDHYICIIFLLAYAIFNAIYFAIYQNVK